MTISDALIVGDYTDLLRYDTDMLKIGHNLLTDSYNEGIKILKEKIKDPKCVILIGVPKGELIKSDMSRPTAMLQEELNSVCYLETVAAKAREYTNAPIIVIGISKEAESYFALPENRREFAMQTLYQNIQDQEPKLVEGIAVFDDLDFAGLTHYITSINIDKLSQSTMPTMEIMVGKRYQQGWFNSAIIDKFFGCKEKTDDENVKEARLEAMLSSARAEVDKVIEQCEFTRKGLKKVTHEFGVGHGHIGYYVLDRYDTFDRYPERTGPDYRKIIIPIADSFMLSQASLLAYTAPFNAFPKTLT